MGRLIDDYAVIKAVDKHTNDDGTLDDDISIIIEEVPTACDTAKVITELRENTGDIHFTEDGSFNGKFIEDFEFIQAKTVIQIVEKGGVE